MEGGPWVGSWRPHPRRGPILAEYSTPGPKYWLPGTTGHTAHDPTKYRAPAYSFRGSKCPGAETCSPGPRYLIHSSITKTGKHVAPSPLVTSRPKTKIAVTPGPSDYTTDPANKHVFYTAPSQSMAPRPKDLTPFPTPGPGTYTLPRILGPNTISTHANPCYSMIGKSQYQSAFRDLAQTPGPASIGRVEMDAYKTRAPQYTMGLRTRPIGRGLFPGPADYSPGKLTVTKAKEPAYTFGLRHSVYKASLIPETYIE